MHVLKGHDYTVLIVEYSQAERDGESFFFFIENLREVVVFKPIKALLPCFLIPVPNKPYGFSGR